MNFKKTRFFLLISILTFLSITLSGCGVTKEYLTQIDYKTLSEKINNKDDFILYVGNKSCPHCKDFQPKLQEVINKYKVEVYKLDTATITNDEYDEFKGIVGDTGTPTVMFFYDGVESGTGNRIDGDVKKDIVIERLKANEYIKD